MDNTQNNALGTFGGAAIAAIAWWDRLDRDTQRRLTLARDAAQSANDKIEGWLSSSDYVRNLIPTVRDFVIGVAYASAPSVQPQTIPDLNETITRPNLTNEAAAMGFAYPPRPGQYDGTGRNKVIGELTTFALALIYQETRAALLGMTQPTAPNPDGLAQIFRAYNALSSVAAALNLSLDQYKAAFKRLFTGVVDLSSTDAHADPGKAPVGSPIFAGLTIVPLNPQTVPGYPYQNRNTDTVQHFRVTAPASGVPAGTPIANISFGSEFRYRAPDGTQVPFQPAIPEMINSNGLPFREFGATSITSTGYQLLNITALPGGDVSDIHPVVHAGQLTVQQAS